MDVEKAIQSLIEGDIQAQKRADRADQRADRADKRMDKFDKTLEATANLVRGGIKLVMEERKKQKEEWKKQAEEWKKQREENKELNFKINALIDSQDRADERMRKSEDKFNRWLDEMRKKRTNGNR